MNGKILGKAVALGRQLGKILVATADRAGLPHLAAAAKLRPRGEGRVEVDAWFCPGTMANLQENRRISLVIWNPETDRGYQLLGETEKVEDRAMMNGYIPGEENTPSLPQVERKLIVRVDRVIDFRHAPHSDLEETGKAQDWAPRKPGREHQRGRGRGGSPPA